MQTEDLKSEQPASNQLPLNPPAPEMDGPEARIAKVAQHLGLPGSIVQVSIDHADEKHTLESRGGIKAFANPDDDTQYKKVHIDLSPNKMISRNHADIFWNEDGWRLKENSTSLRDTCGGAEGLAEEDTDDPRRYKEADADADPILISFSYLRPMDLEVRNGAPQAIAQPQLITNALVLLLLLESEVLPRDRLLDIRRVPGYSYGQMIAQAIISTPGESLALSGIYSYIMAKYSYYRHQPPNGWQNSIRHNLSLNRSYEKTTWKARAWKSSPPPMRRRISAISPTRMGVSGKLEVSDVDELEEEEEQKFDLA
ncbi:hypothetical protein DID88_000357, partial [Monilinia fructigena]